MNSSSPTPSSSAVPSNDLSPAGQTCSIVAGFAVAVLIVIGTFWFAIDAMNGIAINTAIAGFAGGCISIASRLLDHGAFTMGPHARRKADRWDLSYMAIRVSVGGSLGVAAAYTTMAIQAGLGSTAHAPMLPVVAAFAAGYAFKAQPINLK